MFGINKDKIKAAFSTYKLQLEMLEHDYNLPDLKKLEKRIALLEEFILALSQAFD